MGGLRAVGIWTSHADDSERLGRVEAGGRVQLQSDEGGV